MQPHGKNCKGKFCMKECLEIIENPDRDNIKLFSQCVKYKTSLEDTFFFLIMTLKEKKELCDRYLICCPAIRTCSKLYTMFRIMFMNYVVFKKTFNSLSILKSIIQKLLMM